MRLVDEFRLYEYQDYGMLAQKEHIHLVRHKATGKICVKKQLESMQKEVQEFRCSNSCEYFPKVYEIVEDNENVLLIEEYIEGINLEEYMMGEALEEEHATAIAIQIGQGLKRLHDYQPMIIYRDLKPENIMITPEGNVKLIDFDISRKYQEGKLRDTELLGTVGYAAPEQFGYFQTDNRTDIFLFGLVFNAMLTGDFSGHNLAKGKYEKLIRKCIELNPEDRYQNMDDILKELQPEKQIGSEKRRDREQEPSAQGKKGQENRNSASWMLPGFRTRTSWKMLLAGITYLMLLWLGLTMEVTSEIPAAYQNVDLWLNRIIFMLSQFFTVFLAFNYRGISEKIPFYRSERMTVRVTSFIVTWFVCIAAAIVLLVIVEDIFFL